MVRDANFADIPAIVRLLEYGYAKSHYAASGLVNIDVAEAKRLLVASIQRHGGRHGGACWVQVADSGAGITGLILGTLTRVYSIGDRLQATDLFWLTSDNADPRAAMSLMKGLIEWAKTCPLVVEINCGTTAIMNDPAEAGKLLERLGMKNYGNLYRLEIGAQP